MAAPAWFILIIASFAQALDSVDDHHYHLLEDLHHELDDYVTGLQALELNARETLDRVYTLEESRTLAKHRANTAAMLKLADERKCQVPVIMKIKEDSESWLERFKKCMNFTQLLVNYENLTVSLYNEYLEIKPMICEGANNLSLCIHHDASVFDHLVCSYDSIASTWEKLETLKGKAIQIVDYFQDLANETLADIPGCFGGLAKLYLTTQKGLIDMSC